MANIELRVPRALSRPRRRALVNAGLGTTALATAAVLIYPKAVALIDGTTTVLGVGAIANLALVFGGLMFLREAQRAFAATRPDVTGSEPGAAPEQ